MWDHIPSRLALPERIHPKLFFPRQVTFYGAMRLSTLVLREAHGDFLQGLQAVGLIPEDRANGAKPIGTDADGQNKRRRISNRIYVGSSDLSYHRDHMEVCTAVSAVVSCIETHVRCDCRATIMAILG